VGVGALRHLGEFGHDVRGRGAIGVTHAHVDDVFTTAARSEFELGGDVKNVGRKAVNARKTALACGRCSHVELSRKRPEPSERRGQQKGRPARMLTEHGNITDSVRKAKKFESVLGMNFACCVGLLLEQSRSGA
jgi:hypothetical protein